MFTEALVQALQAGCPDIEVEVAESTACGAILSAEAHAFDLVLVDMKRPDAVSLEGLSRVARMATPTPVGAVSSIPHDRFVAHCMARGAAGLIDKSGEANAIRAAVQALLDGKKFGLAEARRNGATAAEHIDYEAFMRCLSRQQGRVLVLLGQGLPNRAIAEEMGIKEATVKSHVSRLFKRLRVKSRTQAVLHLHNCDRASAAR